MLAADGRESQHHVKASRGLLRRGAKAATHCRIRDLGPWEVTHGAVNMQAANLLVGIGLRQRESKMGGPRNPS